MEGGQYQEMTNVIILHQLTLVWYELQSWSKSTRHACRLGMKGMRQGYLIDTIDGDLIVLNNEHRENEQLSGDIRCNKYELFWQTIVVHINTLCDVYHITNHPGNMFNLHLYKASFLLINVIEKNKTNSSLDSIGVIEIKQNRNHNPQIWRAKMVIKINIYTQKLNELHSLFAHPTPL